MHIDHGVGRFGGLTRTVENGKVQGDQTRLPRQRRAAGKRPRAAPHLEVQGQDSEPPKIYKLGSGAWQHELSTKKAVRTSPAS
ncbi:MAG: hypothetical protein ACLR76_08335 [Alistipes sp.]